MTLTHSLLKKKSNPLAYLRYQFLMFVLIWGYGILLICLSDNDTMAMEVGLSYVIAIATIILAIIAADFDRYLKPYLKAISS
ncbi:MAG: hypothetical protein PHR77_03190 [Kiritimatiellae bacterium]|nr:hypothetical protein [Kiritimatiellia bacterium]